MKNHRQLIRTILVIISTFMIMNTPFIGSLLLDPNQENFQLLDSLCVALSWIIQLFNKHPYLNCDEQTNTKFAHKHLAVNELLKWHSSLKRYIIFFIMATVIRRCVRSLKVYESLHGNQQTFEYSSGVTCVNETGSFWSFICVSCALNCCLKIVTADMTQV